MTTLTAVALADEGIPLANVGDSRTYLLRDGTLMRLTRDDSLVQGLVDSGASRPRRRAGIPSARSSSTALDGDSEARGTAPRPRAPAPAAACSCARTPCPTPSTTRMWSSLAVPSREACAERLVRRPRRGARDNVSVVVADVVASAASTSFRA